MNDAAQQYLKELGAEPALVAKVEAAVQAYIFLSGSEPERIFVCNTIDPQTNEQSYTSIWGFDKQIWMEAHSDGSTWDVDISSYAHGIYYLGIQYEEIELPAGVSESSRLFVEIQTDKLAYSSLSAVGLNCRALLDIIDALFQPHLRVEPAGPGPTQGATGAAVEG